MLLFFVFSLLTLFLQTSAFTFNLDLLRQLEISDVRVVYGHALNNPMQGYKIIFIEFQKTLILP